MSATGKAGLQRARTMIQIARRDLGLEEDTYRTMLYGLTGETSSTQLDLAQCDKVLVHLRTCGFKSKPPRKPTPDRPHNMDHPQRGAMLGKIEALLLDARRPWNYAHAMARNMFAVDKLDFCHEGQLHSIVAALEVDKRRRAAAADAAARKGGAR